MPFLTAEHERLRRPRNHPTATSVSDPKPKRTQSFSLSSTHKSIISNLFRSTKNNNNGSDESNEPLTNKPNKNENKRFTSMTVRGLGCGSASPASAAAIIWSAADWEAEKVRKKKKKIKKQQRKTTSYNPNTPVVVVVDVSNVCCRPGVGIASDVVPRERLDAERRIHRERSCPARRIASLNNVSASALPPPIDTISSQSDARKYHHRRRQPPRGLPEMMMFQSNVLTGGHLDGYHDQFMDWRLDVDSMSYEELLDLGDKIGYVSKGLQEDEIFCCLRKTNNSILESIPLLMFTDKDWKCSICQEGCRADDEMGRLDCGHYHHINCIKQWLLQKNACPICKTAPVADK